MRLKWTESRIADLIYMRKNYAAESVAERFGFKNINSLRGLANRIGAKTKEANLPWTKEQEEILIKNNHLTTNQLRGLLNNKSPSAIRHKRGRMKGSL